MKYKDALAESMNGLARDPKTVFLGYNTRCGRANGTLKDVPATQIIETPLAENLMMGMAIGMALEGYRPVVYFERFDFIFNALDSIVNHLNMIKLISDGEFDPAVIIRAVVGGTQRPLFTGPTHTQDYTAALRRMVTFPVTALTTVDSVRVAYDTARLAVTPMMFVEYKDLYEQE